MVEISPSGEGELEGARAALLSTTEGPQADCLPDSFAADEDEPDFARFF